MCAGPNGEYTQTQNPKHSICGRSRCDDLLHRCNFACHCCAFARRLPCACCAQSSVAHLLGSRVRACLSTLSDRSTFGDAVAAYSPSIQARAQQVCRGIPAEHATTASPNTDRSDLYLKAPKGVLRLRSNRVSFVLCTIFVSLCTHV